MRAAGVRASGVLGHQDPGVAPRRPASAVRRRTAATGPAGRPVIMRYDTETKKAGR